jgi:hypothetical protein
LAGVAGYHAD